MQKNDAFTLIELSIVLLIISLIMAGITLGKTIVNNSKIIAVISEINQYRSAINQFKNQYGALPGDITNASTFWPKCTSASGDGGVCDGNGDGIIGIIGQYYWGGTTYNNNENLRAWQHLSLAKIIPGSYSGFGPNNSNIGKFDFNIPRSKYPNSGYSFYSDACYDANYFQKYWIMLSAAPLSSSFQGPYSITPADSYFIDSKIDDSNPKTGTIIARSSDGGSEGCGQVSTSLACVNAVNSTYYTSNINAVCLVYIGY